MVISGAKPDTIYAEINISEIFSVIFRYIILIIICFFVFYFLKKKSIQFILFIVVFILNFFTILFLYRDLLATNLVSDFFNPSTAFNIQDSKGIFIKIFIGVIFITLLLQVASIAIMLVVFDYGKKSTNNFYTPVMTTSNSLIVDEYVNWLRRYFMMIGVFAYVTAISYTKNEKIRNILINLGGIIPTGFLLGTSIYGTVLSVKFLNNKKYKRALYK